MAEEFLNQISAKCSVIIIGAGQAGLSIAHSLQKKGIKPLILEKNYVGFSWKEQRWDSFCLVTPNWQCTLPDYQYSGKDPNGFMDKENIDFYKNLKNLLDETSSWPSEYIYKFIYKSNENNIEILKDIFKDSSANFNIKKSKNEKYTSVSVKIIAKDPDLIINNYKKVAKKIENVILL